MIPKNLTILYVWVSRNHVCELDQNPGLTGIGICFGCYQQNWETWKGFEFFIFWWSDDNLWTDRLCCVYILTYAIDSSCFIEQFITLLSVLITFGVFCNYLCFFITWRSEQEYKLSQVIGRAFLWHKAYFMLSWHTAHTPWHTHTHTQTYTHTHTHTHPHTHTVTHTHTHTLTHVRSCTQMQSRTQKHTHTHTHTQHTHTHTHTHTVTHRYTHRHMHTMVIGPFLPTQLGNHNVSEPHPEFFLLFSNPSHQ